MSKVHQEILHKMLKVMEVLGLDQRLYQRSHNGTHAGKGAWETSQKLPHVNKEEMSALQMLSIQGSPPKCVNFKQHHSLLFGVLCNADIILLGSVLWAGWGQVEGRGSVPVGLVRRMVLCTLLRR